jgi:tetratricopeptide (TPR) repeat protein
LQGDQQRDEAMRDYYYAQALARYTNALRHDPQVRDINGESVHGMMGALHRQQGNYAKAIACYEEAMRRVPHSSYPLSNLALLHFQQGHRDEARAYFEQSIGKAEQRLEANSADYWALSDKATAYIALGRSDLAPQLMEDLLQRVTILGPLESFRNGLILLSNAETPPPGIESYIQMVQAKIDSFRSAPDAGTQP